MKSSQTFSVLIWANKARMSKGELTLFAHITVEDKRAEIALNKRINPKSGIQKQVT